MIQTVEAMVDASGQVRLLGDIRVDRPRRALVTILDEPSAVPARLPCCPRRRWPLIGTARRRTQHGRTFSR